MTTPEPTAEQTDAVARVLQAAHPDTRVRSWPALDGFMRSPFRTQARRLLTTDDPDAQAALAANLPREVRLAALVADGTLRLERSGGYKGSGLDLRWVEEQRLATPWKAKP